MAIVFKYLPRDSVVLCSLCIYVVCSSLAFGQNEYLGVPGDGYGSDDLKMTYEELMAGNLTEDISEGATFGAALARTGSVSGGFEGIGFNSLTGEVTASGGVAEIPSGEKGAQKPFAQTGTMLVNSELSNYLYDEIFVQERMSKFLSTKVGLASAAISFSQPAAAQVYMQAVTVGYQHVQASRESHNAFLAAIAQHPNGPMMRDIYLGCLERKTREEGGAVNPLTPKMSMYNAIAACQGDTYANKSLTTVSNSGANPPTFDDTYFNNIRNQLNRRIDTSYLPEHDPCHPLHPLQQSQSKQWADAQVAEAGQDNVKARIMLTDKLFCEFHFDEGKGGITTNEQKAIRRMGLLTESYFRKVIGNAALIWQKGWLGGNPNVVHESATEIEWQKVAPRTMAWPPSSTAPEDQYPAPEVLPLYRAGEMFVALTQFMRNRCEVHNQLEGIDFGASSALTRNMSGGALGSVTLQVYNGTSPVALSGAEAADLIKTGYCSTQGATIDRQRAFVSIPKLPFNGKTCDAFWYRTKDHFLQEGSYNCGTLVGCIDPAMSGVTCGSIMCKDGSSCPLSFKDIRDNVTNYPLWAQMYYAYSAAGGYLVFREELKQLYAQIESMTGSRYTWMLDMARELIESRIDSDIEDDNAVVLTALEKEIEKAIKDEVENPGGGAIISSPGGKSNAAGGLTGG